MTAESIDDNLSPLLKDDYSSGQSPSLAPSHCQPRHSKRGKGWTDIEDEQLCRAWLDVLHEGDFGQDQKPDGLWARIYDSYVKAKTTAEERSQVSLENRWSVILRQVDEFCGCMATVEDRNEFEKSTEDKIRDVMRLYTITYGKRFKLLHCWYILRNAKKWKDTLAERRHKKSKRKRQRSGEDEANGHSSETHQLHPLLESIQALSSDGPQAFPMSSTSQVLPSFDPPVAPSLSDTPPVLPPSDQAQGLHASDGALMSNPPDIPIPNTRPSNSPPLRPSGRKAPKLAPSTSQKTQKDETAEALLRANEQLAVLSEKKLKMMEQASDDSIMSRDLSTMDEISRLYYQKRKEQILERLLAEGGNL